ncbi:MAG: class I SAM-dependent DNA methyltransferase [Allobaculum sp.]|nr:class I SAM-dependent DNA methyltransferase [Allobaculum sp.]
MRNHPSGKHKNAFLQARSYYNFLPNNERGRYIICCNFKSFDIYDMNHPHDDPIRINLENLEEDYPKLEILIDPAYLSEEKQIAQEQKELSLGAAKLVAKLYDQFLKIYNDHPSKEEANILNILVVRLVFCFFAEDAGLFDKGQFHNFLKEYSALTINLGLTKLFEVLDTKFQDRNKITIPSNLLAFPYVNGGLFSQRIEVPTFTPEIMQNLVEGMSDFKWAKISPTIFGAVFESTLNPETRRAGGMHYTSIENIHKVIDPLFLDDLKEELEKIKGSKQKNERIRKAKEFQNKLASLKFLDPACGSGNFLTESFLCLRNLENEALEIQLQDSPNIPFDTGFIKVTIEQFYGIEINGFAVSVARTALYIAEAQMYKETQRIVTWNDNFLPLRPYENIHKENALRIDWNEVVPVEELNYIIGNPPFVGYSFKKDWQKKDILDVVKDSLGKPIKGAGNLDYVAGWFYKATYFTSNTQVKIAFVSTNSIIQGEQAILIWKTLLT